MASMEATKQISIDDNQNDLENPIKVRWTGKARESFEDSHNHQINIITHRVNKVLSRQKTNVVIEDRREAGAMVHELEAESKNVHLRVAEDIIEAMKSRGYEPTRFGEGFDEFERVGKPVSGLEHAPDAIPSFADSFDDRVDFAYENESGDTRVHHSWVKSGDTVLFYDIESQFTYVDEEWQVVNRFTREYDLHRGTDMLVGDGSGWDGARRNWREWAEKQFNKSVELRFQTDYSDQV